jgi:hypothetical protein
MHVFPSSRCVCASEFCRHAARKPFPTPPAKKEGGGAPQGASNHWPRSFRARPRLIRSRSPSGAPPRLSPEVFSLPGSTPGHASWDLDPAGVTRLRLSQSRDCTSRTGRSTGVNDARSRPGAGRNAARGDRSRSTFESTLAKGPSAERDKRGCNGYGDRYQGAVSKNGTRSPGWAAYSADGAKADSEGRERSLRRRADTGCQFHLRALRFHLRAMRFGGLKPSEARNASVGGSFNSAMLVGREFVVARRTVTSSPLLGRSGHDPAH